MAGPNFYTIVYEDSQHVLAVVGGGILLYSTDGGITWSVTVSGVSVGLYGVIVATVNTDGITVHDGLNLGLTLFGYKWRDAQRDVMANTQSVEFSFSVVDEIGTKANVLINGMVDPTSTATNLIADFTALGGAIDAMSGAQIEKGSIRLTRNPDGAWKTAPAAGSRVEATALINFGVAENTRRWGVDIPAVLDSLIVSGKVNTAAAAVSDLVKLLDGTTPWTAGVAANVANQIFRSAIDMVYSFRQRRKQLGRSSFELVPAANQ